MNSSWLGHRIAFGLLGLLVALPGWCELNRQRQRERRRRFRGKAGSLRVRGRAARIPAAYPGLESPRLAPGALLYETPTGPNTVLAACDYTKLVEAGDPSQSALVRLINRTCGTFTMPASCNKTTCLSAADLTAINDWIQAARRPEAHAIAGGPARRWE